METRYEVSKEQVNAYVTQIGLLSLKLANGFYKKFANDRDLRTYSKARHYLDIATEVKNYLEEHT